MIDSTVPIMSVSAVSDINIRNVSRFQLKIKITALATNQCFIGFKFLRDSQQIPSHKLPQTDSRCLPRSLFLLFVQQVR